MESAQAERVEVDIPFAVVDLDEPDELLAQRLTDIDPMLVPADPAIAVVGLERGDSGNSCPAP